MLIAQFQEVRDDLQQGLDTVGYSCSTRRSNNQVPFLTHLIIIAYSQRSSSGLLNEVAWGSALTQARVQHKRFGGSLSCCADLVLDNCSALARQLDLRKELDVIRPE